MKRVVLTAAALLLALLCAACSGPMGGSVEELLEAPKLSQSQTLVMEELNRYIGGSAKLQYPRRGEFLSPFVFKDINGDGREEAVVFYGDEGSESKNKYVRVALLAQEDGKWTVLWDEEGLGTEVEAVSFSSMYGPDTATLIVGYASANLKDKFLAVYTYKEDEHTMQKVDERSYSEYALADFTGSGTDDLVVLSSLTQPGPMEVSLLTVREGELQPVTAISLDSLLQDCAGIYTSLSNGQFSLVVDGNTSGGTLVSEQLYFDSRTGGLASMSTKLTANIPTLSTRVGASLRSRDVDEDGAVEIPVVLGNDVGCPWITQYDFWRELYYFHKYVGVSNAFALYTATGRSDQLVGIGQETGTLEPGKAADLIVTAADPLADLRALRHVELVMSHGQLHRAPQVKHRKNVEAELDRFL